MGILFMFVNCGFEVIDAAKFKRLLWQVETGRRDSNPVFVFPLLKKSFAYRGLTVADLVALLGGHTLGRTSCAFVAPTLCAETTLCAFSGNGGLDPLIDRGYAVALMQQCPSVSSRGTVPMDPGSESKFDPSYYSAVKANRGVLLTDAVLLQDDEAARLITEFQDKGKFLAAFAASIGRMGAIGKRWPTLKDLLDIRIPLLFGPLHLLLPLS